MLERDRRALRKRSAILCKQLVVDELLIQSLQADDILTESMAERIMVCEQTDIWISIHAGPSCNKAQQKIDQMTVHRC